MSERVFVVATSGEVVIVALSSEGDNLPSYKADPLSDPRSRQGANAEPGLSVCPLGDECLGYGPVCFEVAGVLDMVEHETLLRMSRALRAIGYSLHTGAPRFGLKAQIARWGLGEDTFPASDGAAATIAS